MSKIIAVKAEKIGNKHYIFTPLLVPKKRYGKLWYGTIASCMETRKNINKIVYIKLVDIITNKEKAIDKFKNRWIKYLEGLK